MPWPHDFIKPEDMAWAGFFYIGDYPKEQADNVQCPHCYKKIHSWEEGDDPYDVHRKVAPLCPYVYGKSIFKIQDLEPGTVNPKYVSKYYKENKDVKQNNLPLNDIRIEMTSNTDLHNSVYDGDIEQMENLLKNSLDVNDVNIKNELGQTPFYLAAGSLKGIYISMNKIL